ncbi:MAG: hypothetical protein KAX20_08030, partial [Candidatus Omnitrophica bacterium]|nr:hypothetical protein [Candidatus Omnitrophota bacterium]
MATNKELTAQVRELKQQVKKFTADYAKIADDYAKVADDYAKIADKNEQLSHAVNALKAQLVEDVAVKEKLVNALSGFSSPAYETYL